LSIAWEKQQEYFGQENYQWANETYSRMYPGSCINLFKPASKTLCATYNRILRICYKIQRINFRTEGRNESKMQYVYRL